MAVNKRIGKKHCVLANGDTYVGRIIGPDEWRCPNAGCQKECPDPRGYWIWQKNSRCNRCGAPRPKKSLLFKDSKDGQAQAKHNGGAGTGGGKGGNDVGGRGGKKETPQQKKLRELEEEKEEYECQQKIKKLEKAKKHRGGGEADEQGDDEDESATPTELLELEVRSAEKTYKYHQEDLADRKAAGAQTEEAQRRVDEAKETLEGRKQAVRESKDPQERLRQSSTKAKSVQDAKNKLCDSLKEEMAAKAETEEKLVQHQETIDELVTKIEAKKVELDRLNKESFSVQELVIGAEPTGLDKLVERAGASILEKFDNPLLRNDKTVLSKRTDVDAAIKSIATALQELEAIGKQITEGLDGAKEAAAKEAEKAATEASEKAKVAQETCKAAEVGKASVAPRPQQPRKPHPASALRDVVMEEALKKPIHDRDEDELLATAKGGKLRKTEPAASAASDAVCVC